MLRHVFSNYYQDLRDRVSALALDLDRALDRAHHCNLELGRAHHRALALDRTLDRALALDLDRALDRAHHCNLDLGRIPTLDLDRILALDLDRTLASARTSDLDRTLSASAIDLDFAFALARASDLDRTLALALDLDRDLGRALGRDLDRTLAHYLEPSNLANARLIAWGLVAIWLLVKEGKEEKISDTGFYYLDRNLQAALDLYTFFALIDERRKGNLPVWEGIRIIKERVAA